MYRAGRAIAASIEDDFEEVGGLPADGVVLVLAGKGHNAGDAFICVNTLLDRHPALSVHVLMAFPVDDLKPNVRGPFELLRARAEVTRVSDDVDVRAFLATLVEHRPIDLCLDGLLGMNFHPPLAREPRGNRRRGQRVPGYPGAGRRRPPVRPRGCLRRRRPAGRLYLRHGYPEGAGDPARVDRKGGTNSFCGSGLFPRSPRHLREFCYAQERDPLPPRFFARDLHPTNESTGTSRFLPAPPRCPVPVSSPPSGPVIRGWASSPSVPLRRWRRPGPSRHPKRCGVGARATAGAFLARRCSTPWRHGQTGSPRSWRDRGWDAPPMSTI